LKYKNRYKMRTQICVSLETLFQNHPQKYEKLDSTDKHSQIKLWSRETFMVVYNLTGSFLN
jgi:hypothetical protein